MGRERRLVGPEEIKSLVCVVPNHFHNTVTSSDSNWLGLETIRGLTRTSSVTSVSVSPITGVTPPYVSTVSRRRAEVDSTRTLTTFIIPVFSTSPSTDPDTTVPPSINSSLIVTSNPIGSGPGCVRLVVSSLRVSHPTFSRWTFTGVRLGHSHSWDTVSDYYGHIVCGRLSTTDS